MRRIQLLLILIFGVLAVWLEFRTIKEDALFGLSMFDEVLLIILCVLTAVCIFKNTIQFRQGKNYYSFVPALTGVLFVAMVFAHKQWRSSLNDSPTLFTAVNYNMGNDGGFVFDFKKNNYLKGEKRDHWSVTYYWGSYKKHGDTVVLNIPLNFKMGRHAIVRDNILNFIDDTVHFEVYWQ